MFPVIDLLSNEDMLYMLLYACTPTDTGVRPSSTFVMRKLLIICEQTWQIKFRIFIDQERNNGGW